MKASYKDLSSIKLKGDASYEQRIEQYNNEIRENKQENQKLQNEIDDLKEEKQNIITEYSK